MTVLILGNILRPMTKLEKDTEPLYWLGKSINAMTRKDLQQALYDANKIIDQQRSELYRHRALASTAFWSEDDY